MKTLFFYDKERAPMMHWSVPFSAVSGDARILSVTAKFQRSIFSGEVELSIEREAVLKLVKELELMYAFQIHEVWFSSFDNLLNFEFRLDECGVIDVELEVSDKEQSVKLRLVYSFDQSFLPELIKGLETIIYIKSEEL